MLIILFAKLKLGHADALSMFNGFPSLNGFHHTDNVDENPGEEEEPEGKERIILNLLQLMVLQLYHHRGEEEADKDSADAKNNREGQGIGPHLGIHKQKA